MFTDKLTLAIAEAAKKCMDEELVGNQHKIDANKNGKVDAHDFKLLRKEEQMSNPGLESLASRLKATRTGKPSNPALEKLAHEKAKAKYLNKEETVNEEEGQNGYVAFSHDGRKADIHANSSYEAHRKAIKHFDAPKAKHHMVVVKLAQKSGKDVVHTATESVQEAAIDDLRDRQAAKREANLYVPTAKKEDPAKRVVQGNQYGGAKQKDEKEVDEAVDMGQADRTMRTKNSSANNTYHVKDKANKIVSTHDNHASAMRGAMKDMDNYRVVKEEVEGLEESKAHIEQHLADKDINAKVTGKVVKVHSSDVSATKKHIQNAGYKDHTVVGGLNEEKMSDEDMDQREKIVKGMKKNLQGFKARYGDRAKDVMYATATKQAMKEGAVPSTEKTVKVKHATSGKEIVVTAKSADKYKSQGYHLVKEESEHTVHVDDGSKYDEEPHPKDAEHVMSGVKKHGGKFAGHSDKGAYFKFGSRTDAKNFVDHVKKSPHRSVSADLHESRVKNINKAVDKLAIEEIEQIDEVTSRTKADMTSPEVIAQKYSMYSNDTLKTLHAKSGDFRAKRELAKRNVKEEVELDEAVAAGPWHVHDTKTDKVHSTYSTHKKAINAMDKLNDQHAGYDTPGGLIQNKFGARAVANANKPNSSSVGYRMKKEEVEQIDELSKSTLGSYVKKAALSQHYDNKNFKSKEANNKDTQSDEEKREGVKKSSKRTVGVMNAINRLTKEEVEQIDEASIKLYMGMYQVWHKGKKIASYNSKTDAQDHANSLKEEVEQIDELSKGTLGSYVKKASVDIGERGLSTNAHFDSKHLSNLKKMSSRVKNINKAVDKLTKEEVDSDTFNAELADNKAKAAGTKKQPDIAKASVQAVKQESFSSKLTALKESVRSYLKDRNNG